MTLLELRTQLVKETGRYDLVDDAENADYGDNGFNEQINEAQRWLDRHCMYKKDDAWLTKTIVAGQSLVTFTRARYIEQVWIADATNGRTLLTRKPLDWLRTEYKDVPLSAVSNGEPLYWAPAIAGLSPELYDEDAADLTADGITDIDFYSYGNHYLTGSLLVFPPSDSTRTIQVLARWYQKELSLDADVSFWSVAEPGLLRKAVRLQLEGIHRNSQGQNDIVSDLLEDLQQLSYDLTAEEIAGPASSAVMNG